MKNSFDKDALNFHNKTLTSTKKDFSRKSKKYRTFYTAHIQNITRFIIGNPYPSRHSFRVYLNISKLTIVYCICGS